MLYGSIWGTHNPYPQVGSNVAKRSCRLDIANGGIPFASRRQWVRLACLVRVCVCVVVGGVSRCSPPSCVGTQPYSYTHFAGQVLSGSMYIASHEH